MKKEVEIVIVWEIWMVTPRETLFDAETHGPRISSLFTLLLYNLGGPLLFKHPHTTCAV